MGKKSGGQPMAKAMKRPSGQTGVFDGGKQCYPGPSVMASKGSAKKPVILQPMK